jgi:hypothetical protein
VLAAVRALDRGALGYAIGVESVLAALAAFGGPHGALGAWPWMLQLPGILLVFFVGGPPHYFWRVGAMLLIQYVLWYVLFAAGRAARRNRKNVQQP